MDQCTSFTDIAFSLNMIVPSEIRTTPAYRNQNILVQMYTEQGMSARQVAEHLGCSHDAVNVTLKRLGLLEKRVSGKPPYGWRIIDGRRIPDNVEQEIITLVSKLSKQGWSNQRIADELCKRVF